MKYLVAVDGSAASVDALRHALELAGDTGAEVNAVHVVMPETYFTGGDDPPLTFAEAEAELVTTDVKDAETYGQRVLDRAAEIADEYDLDLETGMLAGEPVDVLTEFAAANNFEAIFVGHRGLSERQEAWVGSTAKDLVGRASVPVTVVR